MKQFKLYNNILGWAIFLVAAITYILTMEPTTSLWDCGEFIASAYKLEVGHPPGAPFFMVLARFFSLFASDVTNVAKMINSLSALSSAFTILFLFWTITHLAKKILVKNDTDLSVKNQIAIYGAGIVGALAYTFSDTFWFSAVEGEVYALSSLFTALVFWAILKWENVADNDKHANRWIILIAYLMGLSIGVHLLNLLAVPAIVMVYYYKKYEYTPKGFIYALLVSVIILGILMYGIIPGIVKVASWFELLFVNNFGMPYNTGVFAYAILILGSTISAIYLTQKETQNKTLIAFLFTVTMFLFGVPFLIGNVFLGILILLGVFAFIYFSEINYKLLNTILIAATVILIGYSSFSMIVIRSIANPPMDENNPDNVFALLSYINREQYGDRPLFYGQYYSAPLESNKNGDAVYGQRNGKYEIIDYKSELTYDKRFNTIFPRMYSGNANHIKEYKSWANIEGRKVKVKNREGKTEMKVIPSFGENLTFFFKYQVGHMYLRYFMWNFSGKQNDTQGHGGILKGNWISGIKFIDQKFIGTQENLPGYLKNDRSRNKYFLLPLLLGLAGFAFQYNRKKKDLFIVLLLFVLTGLAIVIYLNQYPLQPRERDYAYAGSFYAFAIWIGLGVLAIDNFIRKYLNNSVSPAIATILCFALVPTIMAKENWDDHDRSGRYTARDFAYNYLNSCAPNAILFTNGDNDTFPLWYAQEVEGIRTDIRIVNLSLFNTDWYIDQVARKAYDGEPVPFTLKRNKYLQGTNDIIFYNELDQFKDIHIDIRKIITFVESENLRTKVQSSAKKKLDFIPTSNFKLEIDKEKVISYGIVNPEDSASILPAIEWTYKKRYLEKKSMMMLDFLATNEWKRPIYYVSPGKDITMGLDDYLQLEGFAYRLVPIKTPRKDFLTIGRIDTDILYDNLMNKFKWGRMNEPDVLIEFYNKRTASIIRIRNLFARLSNELVKENKPDSAIAVIDRVCELMPDSKYPYDFYVLGLIEAYYNAKAPEKADTLLREFYSIASDNLDYYFSLNSNRQNSIDYEIRSNIQFIQNMMATAEKNNNIDLKDEIEEKFNSFYELYQGK